MTEPTWPVAEVFGPTIQGEGIDQGLPAYFVRMGGCDFKCEWCDTPHAVLADSVRRLPRKGTTQILTSLKALHKGPQWVVLTGGNPLLHELGGLCTELKREGYRVSVETQGTRHKEWLNEVARVCVSPKPPSSGMRYTPDDLVAFLEKMPFRSRDAITDGWWDGRIFLKVVIFDHTDYEWAKELHLAVAEATAGIPLPFYLSAGNDAGATVGNPSRRDERTDDQIRLDLISKARWLTNRVMVDPVMADVKVQAQFHVLLWANELGR